MDDQKQSDINNLPDSSSKVLTREDSSSNLLTQTSAQTPVVANEETQTQMGKSIEQPSREIIHTKETQPAKPHKKAQEEDRKAEKNQTATPPEEETQQKPAPTLSKNVKGTRWYVVHTYSGHEAKVAATLNQRVESQKLQDKVLDILVPTQEKIEIKEGKKNKVKEKIFPGYLLIRMLLDDNTWLVVRTTPGITSFVGMGNRPTPLPDEEVATIQRFMSMEAPKFKTTFSVGEAVKIVDGPFSEFLGSISEIDDEKGKLKILVSIFGRETPVELDFLQVAKL